MVSILINFEFTDIPSSVNCISPIEIVLLINLSIIIAPIRSVIKTTKEKAPKKFNEIRNIIIVLKEYKRTIMFRCDLLNLALDTMSNLFSNNYFNIA